MYCDYEPSKAAVPKLFPTLPPLVTLYQTATPLFWGINQRCGAGPKLFDSGSGYKTPAPAPLRLQQYDFFGPGRRAAFRVVACTFRVPDATACLRAVTGWSRRYFFGLRLRRVKLT